MVVNRTTTMGGRAGGGAGGGGAAGFLGRDTSYKGKIENVESLVHMKDAAMYKATKEAISNFAAKLGIPERNVKLADLSGKVMGIGGQGEVYLNKKYFNQTAGQMKDTMAKNYKAGHLTPTNKPLAHVVNHELAHAAWSTHNTRPNAMAASKEIKSLYKSWSKSGRKGYGKYASSNVNEWWAETSTKAAHGSSDKWSAAVKGIYKKYGL